MTDHYNTRRKTDVVKDAIKQGMKEWMDERYNLATRAIGKYAIRCFCAFGFCLFIKLLVYYHIVSLRSFSEIATEQLGQIESLH